MFLPTYTALYETRLTTFARSITVKGSIFAYCWSTSQIGMTELNSILSMAYDMALSAKRALSVNYREWTRTLREVGLQQRQ